MGIGRNDPCPCGSGKKYKKCCLQQNVISTDELEYRRLSEVYDKLVDRLFQHAEQVFGPTAMRVALEEYLLWPGDEDEGPDAELVERHLPLFLPWFVFNWEYDPVEGEAELSGPSGQTVAELYARKQGPRLDSHERRLIEGVNRRPYSFYEVLEVEPGRRILLRDVLSGDRILVQERAGSKQVKPSDILFGRIAVIDGIGMIVGLTPYVIPPGYKPGLIEFRGTMKEDALAISDEVLGEWDFEIREFFFEIDRLLFTSPRMCNTDGDPIEFHKLVYDIDSAETAFEKLASLCITRKPDGLREEAEIDANGHIRRVVITWERKGHKTASGLSNTILGQITINDTRLTAEVNSARRARTIRGKIESKLGAGARFRVEEIGNLEKMMADEKLEGRAAGRSPEHDALMRNPEIRQYMADMIRKHWEGWVDMEIPALGGKTPRKAVLTSDGAEAVEALLAHAERSGENDPDMREMNREGARLVRELLGLRKPSPVDE